MPLKMAKSRSKLAPFVQMDMRIQDGFDGFIPNNTPKSLQNGKEGLDLELWQGLDPASQQSVDLGRKLVHLRFRLAAETE